MSIFNHWNVFLCGSSFSDRYRVDCIQLLVVVIWHCVCVDVNAMLTLALPLCTNTDYNPLVFFSTLTTATKKMNEMIFLEIVLHRIHTDPSACV